MAEDNVLEKLKSLSEVINKKQVHYINNIKNTGENSINYVITPEMVSYYNYMHEVLDSSLRNLPLDLCTDRGGYMCTNLKLLKKQDSSSGNSGNEQTDVNVNFIDNIILFNNYDITLTKEKRNENVLLNSAISILDDINIKTVTTTNNIRDEFVSNLAALNDMFSKRSKEFTAEMEVKNTELVKLNRDLNACRSVSGLFGDTNDLLTMIEKYKDENKLLQNRSNEKQIIYNTVNEDLVDSNDMVQNLTQDLKNYRDKLNSLYNNEMKQMSVSITNLLNLTEINDEYIKNLLKQRFDEFLESVNNISLNKNEVERLNKLVNNLQNELITVNNSRNEYSIEIGVLNNLLSMVRAKLKDCMEKQNLQHKSISIENKLLVEENKSLKNKLDKLIIDSRTEIIKLKAGNICMRNDLDKLNDGHEKDFAEFENSKLQISKLQSIIDKLNNDLKDCNASKDDLISQLEDIEIENKLLKDTAEKNNFEIGNMLSVQSENEKKIFEDIKKLENVINKHVKRENQQKEREKKMMEEYLNTSDNNQKLMIEIKKCLDEKNKLIKQMGDNTELNNLQSTMNNCSAENSRLKLNIEYKAKEIQNLKKYKNTLNVELSDIKTKYNKLSSEYNKIKSEYTKLKDVFVLRGKANDKYTEQIEKIKKQLKDSSEELAKTIKEKDKISKTLDEKRKALEFQSKIQLRDAENAIRDNYNRRLMELMEFKDDVAKQVPFFSGFDSSYISKATKNGDIYLILYLTSELNAIKDYSAYTTDVFNKMLIFLRLQKSINESYRAKFKNVLKYVFDNNKERYEEIVGSIYSGVQEPGMEYSELLNSYIEKQSDTIKTLLSLSIDRLTDVNGRTIVLKTFEKLKFDFNNEQLKMIKSKNKNSKTDETAARLTEENAKLKFDLSLMSRYQRLYTYIQSNKSIDNVIKNEYNICSKEIIMKEAENERLAKELELLKMQNDF